MMNNKNNINKDIASTIKEELSELLYRLPRLEVFVWYCNAAGLLNIAEDGKTLLLDGQPVPEGVNDAVFDTLMELNADLMAGLAEGAITLPDGYNWRN